MSENERPQNSGTPANPARRSAKPRRRRSRLWRAVKKGIKTLVVLAVVVAAGLFGLKAYITSKASTDGSSADYARATVQSGPMSETVYGTGTTSAKNQPSILAQADGTLTELRVSIGDEVSEGDIIAVISNEELDDTITDAEFALWELDATILETSAGSSVTSIRAPMAGRVMALYGEVGDDALAVFRREGSLAIISTDGRMKVEVDDVPQEAHLALGDTVQVSGETVEITGTVSDLTLQGTHATVTITTDALPMGEAVEVTDAQGRVIGTGTLEVNKPMAVSAYGGTIKSVSVKVGQKVERADTLYRLEDSPLTLTLENLRLQREAAAKTLQDAKVQRENLIVLAPCDGTIASLEVSEGDDITSGMLLGSVLHGEDMTLTIAVDELDVVSVEIGQRVTISIDALSETQMQGEVYKIAPVGTNSGGVTTYDVELAFDAAGTGVRSGMNATGEIEVASASSTLYVPVEAIMTMGNSTYVLVEDGGTQTLASAAGASTGSKTQTGSARGEWTGDTERTGRTGTEGGAPALPGGEGENGGAPALPEGTGRGGQAREGAQTTTDSAAEADVQATGGVLDAVRQAYAGLMAWLYEGAATQSADTVTGTLTPVTVGMQNDDYAEILSGVSAGQTVLYTATSSSSSSSSAWNQGGGRGGNAGGMAMPMGF